MKIGWPRSNSKMELSSVKSIITFLVFFGVLCLWELHLMYDFWQIALKQKTPKYKTLLLQDLPYFPKIKGALFKKFTILSNATFLKIFWKRETFRTRQSSLVLILQSEIKEIPKKILSIPSCSFPQHSPLPRGGRVTGLIPLSITQYTSLMTNYVWRFFPDILTHMSRKSDEIL